MATNETKRLIDVCVSASQRTWRTIRVRAATREEAAAVAMQIARDEVEPNEHEGEDAGEWCDTEAPRRFKVEQVGAPITEDREATP